MNYDRMTDKLCVYITNYTGWCLNLSKRKIDKFCQIYPNPDIKAPSLWDTRLTSQMSMTLLINSYKIYVQKYFGIFIHTYIDNLIDSLILTMNTSGINGEIIEITDGDNSITWGRYLNDLSEIIGKKPIKRNISKSFALIIGNVMIFMYSIFGVKGASLFTSSSYWCKRYL